MTMDEPMRLDPADVLARTPEGTRQMSSRDVALSPKLRSVLFMVDGRLTVGEILGRAGSMRNVLEGQITTLIEMGFIAVDGGREPLPPVAGAKIRLLERLEASGSRDTALLADELLGARSLRELAMRAQWIAYRLRDADSEAIAEEFWSDAKAILIASRDAATSLGS